MKGTKTLTGQLKRTVLFMGIAMLCMWIFFYSGIRGLILGLTLRSMERAANQGIKELNTSFLQMEQLYLAMLQEETVVRIFEQEGNLGFHNAAAAAEGRMQELIRGKKLLNSVILYRTDGCFYRLRGNLSNTGIQRLLYLVQKEDDYICAKLDNENYIGYITRLENGSGGIVMLMKETEIEGLLGQPDIAGMQFVLTAGEEIVASGGTSPVRETLEGFCKKAEHLKSARIGYTPFQLWVSYTAKDVDVHTLFLIAMALMALLLFSILLVFIQFWQDNFFAPIQEVIDGVTAFEGGKEEFLPLTGLEHFDGLICGINDMAARIETKDKALIVSLKKQINAHFIFNILNIIKALAEKGDSVRAGELCGGLSLLLRYANEGENFISGIEEFYILENYVEIMQIRYPNRFQAEIDMEDFLENVELPRMLLQPILENSIEHGLIAAGKKGTVRVYAVDEGDMVSYFVEDDGCGMSEEKLQGLRDEIARAPLAEPEIEGLSHVALVNIERRIKSYFGWLYGLTVNSEEGKGTKVSITLPKFR